MANLNSIKIVSANCQGLRDKKKRLDVLNYLKQDSPNIICLQDTHLLEIESELIKINLKCECYLSGFRTNSRGVAIILCDNFEYKTIKVKNDKTGNLVYLDLELQSFSFRLINIYAPNSDTPSFFER